MRFALLLLAFLVPFRAGSADNSTTIRALLDKQVFDWNRADIASFVQSYAEDCTFLGSTIVEGRSAVEERYRRNYSTPAAMGHLSFTDLKIKKISGQIALVTGAFHLERPQEAGGNKSGIFSLVLERRKGAWRIVLDHTS